MLFGSFKMQYAVMQEPGGSGGSGGGVLFYVNGLLRRDGGRWIGADVPIRKRDTAESDMEITKDSNDSPTVHYTNHLGLPPPSNYFSSINGADKLVPVAAYNAEIIMLISDVTSKEPPAPPQTETQEHRFEWTRSFMKFYQNNLLKRTISNIPSHVFPHRLEQTFGAVSPVFRVKLTQNSPVRSWSTSGQTTATRAAHHQPQM
jgi:hypothetical protein